jgi:hypothetical protein
MSQESPSDLENLLKERYGKSSNNLWKYSALLLLAIGLPWLMWSASYHSNPPARVSLISFQPIDSRTIEITFELDRRDPASSQICTLVARDFEKNIVGEIDFEVPASKTNPQKITAEIPTRLEAVNAGVLECRPKQ